MLLPIMSAFQDRGVLTARGVWQLSSRRLHSDASITTCRNSCIVLRHDISSDCFETDIEQLADMKRRWHFGSRNQAAEHLTLRTKDCKCYRTIADTTPELFIFRDQTERDGVSWLSAGYQPYQLTVVIFAVSYDG